MSIRFMILSCIFMLLTFSAIAQENDPNITKVGISTAFATKNWDETPIGLKQSDLAPPNISFDLKGMKKNKNVFFLYDLNLINVHSNFWIYFFHLGLETNFLTPNLVGGFGFETLYSNTMNNKKYTKTIYDYYLLGLEFHLKYFYKNINFYFNYNLRKISESTIAVYESSPTKIHHDWDNILKIGATSNLEFFLFLAEIAQFRFSRANILSKDFAYAINDSQIYRFGLGVGYQFKKYEFWIKRYQLTNPSDEVSYFYQAAYFAPDYMLAKEFVKLEMIWNF